MNLLVGEMKLQKVQSVLIYLFSFSLVFENWDFMSLAGNSVSKIISYFLVFISFSDYKNTFNLTVFKKYLWPLLGFLGVVLFSIVINYSGNTGWSHILMQIVNNILFFWILTNIINGKRKTIDKMLLMFNIGVLVMVLLFVLGIGTSYSYDGRLSLFGENPNKIGLFCVVSILYIITHVFEVYRNRSWYHYLPLLLLIPLFAIVAGIGSRVTFIGLIISLLLFFMFKKNLNLPKKIGVLILGVIVTMAIYRYFMSFDLLQSRMLRFYEYQDIAGRDRIWELIVSGIISNPVFGLGINGYTELISTMYSGFFSPHNVFIEVVIYSGFIGLIFFLIFLFRIFKVTYHIFKYSSYSYPLLVFIFFLFVFLSGQGLAVKFIWLFYVYFLAYWNTSMMDNIRFNIIWNNQEKMHI